MQPRTRHRESAIRRRSATRRRYSRRRPPPLELSASLPADDFCYLSCGFVGHFLGITSKCSPWSCIARLDFGQDSFEVLAHLAIAASDVRAHVSRRTPEPVSRLHAAASLASPPSRSSTRARSRLFAISVRLEPAPR